MEPEFASEALWVVVVDISQFPFFDSGIEIPPPSTESKTPKTRKVSKKSPERSLGPPHP